MSLRRTFAISRRIADLFRRDHRTLALMFVAPIVIMALLGWVIRDQAPSETRVAVVGAEGIGGPIDVARARVGDFLNHAGLTYHDDITTETTARHP